MNNIVDCDGDDHGFRETPLRMLLQAGRGWPLLISRRIDGTDSLATEQLDNDD
jgi:hypothetical protein